MPVPIDARQLHQILADTPPDQNTMLVGRHGIGKSEAIAAFFAERNRRVVPFFLGQMSDPGDLIGLPRIDDASGRTTFLPPAWWPLDDQPIVLFLDELNRARPEMLQSIMELALNQTLAGRRLPRGSQIVAAVNDGDDYQVTDLDPALVSRFNVYSFEPTVEDWLRWARDRGVDDRVVRFIEAFPHFLDDDGIAADAGVGEFASTLRRTPDRRAWSRVSGITNPHRELRPHHDLMIAAIVGRDAAEQFAKFRLQRAALDPSAMLANYGLHRESIAAMPLTELSSLVRQVVDWVAARATSENVENEVAWEDGLVEMMDHLMELGRNESVAQLTLGLLDETRDPIVRQRVARHLKLSHHVTAAASVGADS